MKKIGKGPKGLLKNKILIGFLALSFLGILPKASAKSAAPVTVEAMVDRNTMDLGDTFEFRVVVNY